MLVSVSFLGWLWLEAFTCAPLLHLCTCSTSSLAVDLPRLQRDSKNRMDQSPDRV